MKCEAWVGSHGDACDCPIAPAPGRKDRPVSLNHLCSSVKNQSAIVCRALFLDLLFCCIDLCVYLFANNVGLIAAVLQ